MDLSHRQWKLAVSSLLIVALQACGGGGGGSSPSRDNTGNGKSLTDIIASNNALRETRYQGARTDALLDATTILPFARAVLSDDFPEQTLVHQSSQAPSSQAASSQTPSPQASSRQALNRLTRQVRETASQIQSSARQSGSPSSRETAARESVARETINENSPCDNRDGSVQVTGVLDENGVGALDYTYKQCVIDNLLFDGAAIVYMSGHETPEYFFYNDTALTVDGIVAVLTGSVRFKTSGEVVSNLVLRNMTTGYHYQMLNYREELVDVQGMEYTRVEGDVYLPELGKVIVNGTYLDIGDRYSLEGDLTLNSGDIQVLLEMDWSSSRVKRTDAKRPDAPLFADIDSYTLLNYNGTNELTFRDRPGRNSPPGYNYIAISPEYPTVRDAIEVVVQGAYDDDGDELQYTYRWYVDGNLVAGQSTNILPAGIARAGYYVHAEVEMSDGYETILGASYGVLVADATGEIVAVDLPSSINVGDSLAVNVRYEDAENGGPTDDRIELVYGPSGAAIDAEGLLRWTPTELFFGRSQVFHFGFRIAGTADTATDIAITVNDLDAPMPLVRSSMKVPTTNNAMAVMQFDSDASREILVSDTYSLVYTLQKSGDQYVQDWVYPYRIGSAPLVKAVPVNLDRSGTDEILVATQKEVYFIASKNALATSRYVVPTDFFIKDMIVADLNNDANDEMVLLLANEHYSEAGTFVVANALTGTVISQTSLARSTASMAIGNVDNDAAQEIVFSNGLVYDGSTTANEWYYAPGFGNLVVTADVDADGIDEIVATQIGSDLRVFSARTRTLVFTHENAYACSLAAKNIDADMQEELIVGDCYWGYVTAYDAATGSLQSQWQSSDNQSGSYSIFVGDPDNDGSDEIGWSTGQSTLVIAETNDALPSWTSGNQPGSFFAAGWANVGAGAPRAVFVTPETINSRRSQRIALLSEEGDLQISEEVSSNWDDANAAVVVDYDRDGMSELFLASADYSNGFAQVLQLSDFSQEWTSQSEGVDAAIRAIASGDINRDGNDDLIYTDGDQLVIVDIVNERILDSLNFANRYVQDVVVANLDGDQALELVIAAGDRVTLWNRSGTTYSQTYSAEAICSRLVVGRTGPDAALQIICAEIYSYSDTTLHAFDANLVRQQSIRLPYALSDLAVMGASNRQQTLMVAANENDAYYYGPAHSVVGAFSVEFGRMLWSSPEWVGQVPKTSLRPFVDSAGDQRLLFASGNAMYITQ